MDSSTLFGISTMAYILAMITYIAYLAFRNSQTGKVATALTITGFISQTIAIAVRWFESYVQWTALMPESTFILSVIRSAPLRNLYESLVFFVWCLILGYLIIEFKYRNRSFGAFITPVAGIALAFIGLSGMSKEISPLVPALQSNWLLVHVIMSFIAYATFAISFSTGLMYLIATSERQEKRHLFWIIFSVFAILLALISQSPDTIMLWIISFAFVIAVDIKQNIDIASRVFSKKEGNSSGTLKTVMTVIGLSLVSIAAILIFIQLVKLQIIKADDAAKLRHLETAARASSFTGNVMGIVGFMFFISIVLIKYLILNKEYYLFWILNSGIFAFVLMAMGLDFLMFRVMEVMHAQDGSIGLRATLLSHSPVIAVLSYASLTAFLYVIWRYGHILKRIISNINISTDLLDEITYKSIAIGLPVFTLGGLIFGAVWADQAWGTYWGWDPKETWSLITFFVYVFFLHGRLLRGWKGKKVAIVAVVGFIIVIFTYLGVNLLLSGLHAYGTIG
ncbi:MAG: cytochrome c biogenesis protein CcsA [Thermodesulfovibrionales bacterium]|nr:cytochrome c biogenesis protein CcsA [Thermodesulfovibrionales bacterium]